MIKLARVAKNLWPAASHEKATFQTLHWLSVNARLKQFAIISARKEAAGLCARLGNGRNGKIYAISNYFNLVHPISNYIEGCFSFY